MPEPLEGPLTEAVSVHRLVESVCEACRHEQQHRTYLDASTLFFDHVIKTGDATKSYLQEQVERIKKYPHHARLLRQGLVQVKKFWSEIHRYVKPAGEI